MKKAILILTFILLPTLALAADADKKAHFGLSTALGVFGAAIMDYNYPDAHPLVKWGGAVGLALIPGVIKEATDDEFDWEDMAANTLGAASGSAAVLTITWGW